MDTNRNHPHTSDKMSSIPAYNSGGYFISFCIKKKVYEQNTLGIFTKKAYLLKSLNYKRKILNIKNRNIIITSKR